MSEMYTFKWTLNDSPEVRAYMGYGNTKWCRGRIIAVSMEDALETLFDRFNHGREAGSQPEGYRSMSVNDFVELTDESGHIVTWVCAPQGWQVIPEAEMMRSEG